MERVPILHEFQPERPIHKQPRASPWVYGLFKMSPCKGKSVILLPLQGVVSYRAYSQSVAQGYISVAPLGRFLFNQ